MSHEGQVVLSLDRNALPPEYDRSGGRHDDSRQPFLHPPSPSLPFIPTNTSLMLRPESELMLKWSFVSPAGRVMSEMHLRSSTTHMQSVSALIEVMISLPPWPCRICLTYRSLPASARQWKFCSRLGLCLDCASACWASRLIGLVQSLAVGFDPICR